MRTVLALSLLLALSGAASAATIHHSHRYYGNYRASHAEMFVPVPGPAYAPAYGPVYAPAPLPGPGPDGGSNGSPYQNWGG